MKKQTKYRIGIGGYHVNQYTAEYSNLITGINNLIKQVQTGDFIKAYFPNGEIHFYKYNEFTGFNVVH